MLDSKLLLEILKTTLPGFSVVNLLGEAVVSSMKILDEEETGESVHLSDLERQAKIIRELAIARRIDTAEKVTIEEFYDTKGDGNIGVKAEEKKVSIGANASGEKVAKRIYTFEGWRDGGLEGINERIMTLLKQVEDECLEDDIKGELDKN